jgi:hypothetical protein
MIPSRIIVVVGVIRAIMSQPGNTLPIASLWKSNFSKLEIVTLSPGSNLEKQLWAKLSFFVGGLKKHIFAKANLDSVWIDSGFVRIKDYRAQKFTHVSIGKDFRHVYCLYWGKSRDLHLAHSNATLRSEPRHR